MVKTYVFYMYFVRWVCLHLMTLMEYVFNGGQNVDRGEAQGKT